MSKNKGFLMIDRQTFSSDYWREPRRFSKFEAWVDILQRAWYADASKLPARKGEVTIVQRKTAARWGWARKTVVRFIAELVENGQLKRTPNPSVYAIGEPMGATNVTKKGAKKETTKATERQRDNVNEGTNKDTNKGTDLCPTYIDNNLINKKGNENAVGSGPATAAPPAPGVNEDGLPYGVTRKQWDQFKAWAATAIPTLWEVGITPTDFRSMRNGSLNNREKFTAILTTMEKTGKPHSVRDEFYRRLDRWEQDKFNGMYG